MTVRAPSFFGTKTYDNVWCVLHANPNPDYVRMELYANENTKSGCKRYIMFEQAKWKKTGMVDLAFGLELKGGKVYTFMVNSREEMKKWILHMCVVCKSLFDTKQEVGVDDKGKVDLDSFLTADNTVVQMNELYGRPSDARLNFFFVAIKPDSDCPKKNLSGLYKMILFEENIYLCELDSEEPLFVWSLFEIKKYGFNSCFFYFIAGSKAEDREGNYAFYTAVGVCFSRANRYPDTFNFKK
ncbi:hypothetical protein Btru_027811 [Bulinus truncatus]|nr:hypothetical protein Btru_027811 [Bulinus truncatus]